MASPASSIAIVLAKNPSPSPSLPNPPTKETSEFLPIETVIKSLTTLVFATNKQKLLITPNGFIDVDRRYLQNTRRKLTNDGAEPLVKAIRKVQKSAIHYLNQRNSKKTLIKRLLPLTVRGLENQIQLYEKENKPEKTKEFKNLKTSTVQILNENHIDLIKYSTTEKIESNFSIEVIFKSLITLSCLKPDERLSIGHARNIEVDERVIFQNARRWCTHDGAITLIGVIKEIWISAMRLIQDHSFPEKSAIKAMLNPALKGIDRLIEIQKNKGNPNKEKYFTELKTECYEQIPLLFDPSSLPLPSVPLPLSPSSSSSSSRRRSSSNSPKRHLPLEIY